MLTWAYNEYMCAIEDTWEFGSRARPVRALIARAIINLYTGRAW